MITVEPVKDSQLVEIHVDSHNPEKSQLYADAVAKAYIDKNFETMHESTNDAVDWISSHLNSARDELNTSEIEFIKSTKNNNLLTMVLEKQQEINKTPFRRF